MSTDRSGELVELFLDLALRGDSRGAVRLALDLLDSGVPEELVIENLLAVSQREIGERWHRNIVGVAEEHLCTSASESSLHALAAACPPEPSGGLVAVTCAEGDWHSLAAHMFAEQLRGRGVVVAYLGASTPADHVARFFDRHRPEVVAVSCNLPLFFRGLTRIADVAHALGIPVLAGGRATGDSAERSLRLGADGWARGIDEAMTKIAEWGEGGPHVRPEPARLDSLAIELESRANDIAELAFDDLARRFPAMAGYDDRQVARTREDLAFIVGFASAAQLVDEPSVLTTNLDWLDALLSARGVPRQALIAGLEALQPLLADVSTTAGHLGEIGLRFVDDLPMTSHPG